MDFVEIKQYEPATHSPVPTSPSADEEKGHPYPARMLAAVSGLKAAPSGQRTRGKVKKKSKAKNQGKRALSKHRSPLRDVSASNVSLRDAADFIGAAWKYGQYALALVNDEEKKLYIAHVDAPIPAQSIYYVSAIGQGNDYYQRQGISIRATNLRVDYTLKVNTTAVFNAVRIIIFRDFMNTGANPGVSDLLQDTVTSNTLIITSPYKVFNADRFEVMYDRVHTCTTGADDAYVHCRVGLSINDHVLYQATGSTVAAAWQGAVFIFVCSSDNVNQPTLTMSTLLDFVDS